MVDRKKPDNTCFRGYVFLCQPPYYPNYWVLIIQNKAYGTEG